MVRLGKPVLDVIGFADHAEAHLARPGGVAAARLLGELDAPFDFAQDRIVSQDRVDAVEHGFQQKLEELSSRPPVSLVDELRDGELAGAVDVDEQIEPFDEFRSALPSAVCTSAISMWKKPIG